MRITKWNSPENPPDENEWVLVFDYEQNPGELFLCKFEEGYYIVKPNGGWFCKDEISGWIYALGEHK